MAAPTKFQNPNSKEMQSIAARAKNGKKTRVYFVFSSIGGSAKGGIGI